MIQMIRKIVGIGSSEGVTIAKNDLAKLGAKRGDELKITAELVNKHKDAPQQQLMAEYDEFVEQYGQTLKNLANR